MTVSQLLANTTSREIEELKIMFRMMDKEARKK
jgi:hypothetical protein